MAPDLPVGPRVSGAVGWVRETPRRVLAVLAGNSVVFNFVGSGTVAAWAARLADAADGTLLPAVLSALSLSRGVFGTIGAIASFSLAVYVVCTFGRTVRPRVRDFSPVPADDPVLVATLVLAALPGVWVALVAGGAGLTVSPPPSLPPTRVLVPIAAAPVLLSVPPFTWYVYRRYLRPLPVAEQVDALMRVGTGGRDEAASGAYLAQAPRVRLVALGVNAFTIATLTATAGLLVGSFVTLFALMYPLPELLVLGGVATRVIDDRVGFLSLPSLGTYIGLDSILRSTRVMLRDARGLDYLLALVFGLSAGALFAALSVGGFSLGVSAVVTLAAEPSPLWTAPPLGWWNVAGMLVTLILPGAYALVFWSRMWVRVGHALLEADGTSVSVEGATDGVTTPEGDLGPRPVRPWLGLLPVTPAVVAFAVLVRAGIENPLVAVLWPTAVVVAGIGVVRTRRTPVPQPVTDEFRAVFLAGLVQVGWFLVIHVLVDTVDLSSILVALAVMAAVVLVTSSVGAMDEDAYRVGGVPIINGVIATVGVTVAVIGGLLFEGVLSSILVSGGGGVAALGACSVAWERYHARAEGGVDAFVDREGAGEADRSERGDLQTGSGDGSRDPEGPVDG